MRVYLYTFVTTAIVLVFTLAEWATERFVSDRSRVASTAIEICIVLIGTLVFRPIHQRVEGAVEEAFSRKKNHALAAVAKFRRELTSFNDFGQLLRRVIEAVDHHLEARACAVYLRRDAFRAEASSYDAAADDVAVDDPLVVRLRSSGAPARPPLLKSSAPGTHVFPMTSAGDLIGFLSVDAKHRDYDAEELHALSGLAADLAGALVTLDPRLRPSRTRAPNNLPAPLQPLVGREREIGELNSALAQARLITITGAGGVGKTRVALHCAADALEQHEHGAWFIDLAPITDGSLVAATMLSAFDAGPAETGTELGRLLEYLRPRDALLVIDNCEHLVADVATVVVRILAACPRIAILATSRELLHLDHERVYRLGPLPPAAAALLFGQRASAVSPGFKAEENAARVHSICDRLDGIPLAIELAAARVRALSVDEILGHLDERFRLLTSGARTALPRQQTLVATIAWSYDLLTPEEQSLFCRLSAFRGSFSLPAAAAVCAHGGLCDEYHVLDVLTSLCDKSLLTVTLALATRYRLPETIRAYASERAIENRAAAIASQQHAAYFANLAAHAYHEFDSQLAPGWLERLAPDIDNFRAALGWTLEGPGDRSAGAQLAADCGPIFLRLELLGEGLRWCELACGATLLAPVTAGRLEYVASMMQNNLGQNEAALGSAQRAVAAYRASSDLRGLVRALSQEAQLLARSHRFEEAKAPANEAIREARELGEPRLLIAVLRRCAFSVPPAEIDRARALFEEALNVARLAHARDEICRVLQWWASRESGERAIELATEALEWADGDVRTALEVTICVNAFGTGRFDDAEPHAREAVALTLETSQPLMRALAIAYWSPFLAARAPDDAALLFGYAKRRLQELGWNGEDDDRRALDAASEIIEKRLESNAFEKFLQRGAGMRLDEALAMLMPALARSHPGNVSVDTGDGVGTLLR